MSSWTLIPILKWIRWPRMWKWSSNRLRRRSDWSLRPGRDVNEEQKKLEEKEQIVRAMKLVTKEAAEVVVEREWRIVLQVSFFFSGFFGFWLETDLYNSRTWRHQ